MNYSDTFLQSTQTPRKPAMSEQSSTSSSLRPLYLRAIASPSTITRAERNQIQRRPPPEEEDTLCLSATSHTYAALVQKAIREPSALTETEARVLSWGANLPSRTDIDKTLTEFKAMPKDEYKLMNEARKATSDPDENKAFLNAWQVVNKAREEKRVAARREREAARGNSGQMRETGEQKKAWVKMLEEKGWEEWGFVCFRTSYGDDQAWSRFKDRMAVITAEALARVTAAEAIRGNWRVIYVEDEALEGMPVEGLREKFERLVEGGGIPEGIRRDYFLSADDKVVKSFQEEKSEPVMPVWEARFDAAEPHKYGYPGAVAVLGSLLFATVYPMILMEEPTPLQTLHLIAGK